VICLTFPTGSNEVVLRAEHKYIVPFPLKISSPQLPSHLHQFAQFCIAWHNHASVTLLGIHHSSDFSLSLTYTASRLWHRQI
jgi:hypothetical protein